MIVTNRCYDKDDVLRIGNNEIEKVNQMKDLGVIVDSSLGFDSHINQIAAKAFVRSNLILKCFLSRDVNTLVRAFKVYVRPILEYASCVWSPHTITLINRLESVQRKFTKRLPGLRSFNYRTRLVKLNLESLEKRRLYQDLITTYKMLFGLYDIPNTSLFKLSRNDHNTRGHVYKLQLNHCRIDTRKFFFAERVVKQWNSMLATVDDFASLRTFKSLMMRTDFSQFLSI